jgi:hypothetical protein
MIEPTPHMTALSSVPPAASLLRFDTPIPLFVIAAAALGLLLIGIHKRVGHGHAHRRGRLRRRRQGVAMQAGEHK